MRLARGRSCGCGRGDHRKTSEFSLSVAAPLLARIHPTALRPGPLRRAGLAREDRGAAALRARCRAHGPVLPVPRRHAEHVERQRGYEQGTRVFPAARPTGTDARATCHPLTIYSLLALRRCGNLDSRADPCPGGGGNPAVGSGGYDPAGRAACSGADRKLGGSSEAFEPGRPIRESDRCGAAVREDGGNRTGERGASPRVISASRSAQPKPPRHGVRSQCPAMRRPMIGPPRNGRS